MEHNLHPSSDARYSSPPKIFVLVENTRKSNNLGPELRCASAFGVESVVAVGFSKCADYGSHGASKHVKIIAFPVIDQALRFLTNECRCESIVGLLGSFPGGYNAAGYKVVRRGDLAVASETSGIVESSSIGWTYPVWSKPFMRCNTCVVVGKPFAGLPFQLAQFCDRFVHIPHLAISEVASVPLLSQPACLSILLRHITDRLGYEEHTFQGHKFLVDDFKKQRDDQFAAKEQARRLAAREQQIFETDRLVEENVLENLFDSLNEEDY